MKKALFLVLCAGFLNTAMAKDSTWQLCTGTATIFEENVSLVVNVYEHRNSTGDGRETLLTMIYGGNVLSGTFDSTENDAGVAVLNQDESSYNGNVAVDYNKSTIAVNGTLTLSGEATPLKTTLKCKTLAN